MALMVRGGGKQLMLVIFPVDAYIICMYHFTKHVLQRMKERGFSAEEVLMIINGEVPTLMYPSPREKNVDLYFGRIGEKFALIPVDRVDKSIITIRAMRKEEKEVYLREITHEKDQ